MVGTAVGDAPYKAVSRASMKRMAVMGSGSLKASAHVAPLFTPSYCVTPTMFITTS